MIKIELVNLHQKYALEGDKKAISPLTASTPGRTEPRPLPGRLYSPISRSFLR